MKKNNALGLIIIFLLLGQYPMGNLYGQVDTTDAHLRGGAVTHRATMAESSQVGSVQAMASSAPSITYGGARTFGVNQDISWSPINNGGTAEFTVTVEQTITGYYNPLSAACASDGTLYIANTGYHSILKRTSSGVQSLLAGGNSTSYGFVNGTGSAARFRHPSFLAIDASGNIYVADQQNHRIRKVTPSGVVTTFAGSGSIGSANGTGTAASFQYPMGLAFGPDGNLYVADAYNNKIRKITPSGVVSDHAGSGIQGMQDGTLSTARFYQPKAIRFDSNGDLYVADRLNNVLRKVSGGNVTTIAGNGTTGFVDGQGSAARFNGFSDMVVKRGNIYSVDMLNNALRYVSPTGNVLTISTSGQITNPYSVSEGPDGRFYVAENTSNRIKKLNVTRAYSISPALPSGLLFDESTGRITGKLSSPLNLQTYTVTARNGLGNSTATVSFSIGDGGLNLSIERNYILESIPRKPYKSLSQMNAKPVDSVNRHIQYFDGLGRPEQSIQWQAGANGKKDIVQPIEYDRFGRESTKYLPYSEQNSSDGSYKTTVKINQENYYKAASSWDSAVVKTLAPYAVTIFEESPLNRISQQGAPGIPWQPVANRTTVTSASNSGHTVLSNYGGNTSGEVNLWVINASGASTTASYSAGKLHKTVVRDENWTNISSEPINPTKDGTIEEFKDFEGRIVLRRSWETGTKAQNTYYVYDDFGNLRYVIPPGFTATTLVLAATGDFHELVYAYRYDEQHRLVERKVPGKGWEFIVYNKNDRPILTQDSVQRGSNKWSYTKYDAFGKVVSTGVYTNSAVGQTTRRQLQALADAVSSQWESRINASVYTNSTFPNTTAQIVEHTVNYYDDYLFKSATILVPTTGLDSTYMVKGLLTGTKITKVDGTMSLISVYYYDKHGRMLQSVAQNHLSGTDRITNTYNFPGELLTSRHEHMPSSGMATTILTSHTYDHTGRLKDTKKKINTQTEILQSRLVYNEIGQLRKKHLHQIASTGTFLNTIGYKYNERGWLKESRSENFIQVLRYDSLDAGYTKQYNGNISQQYWRYTPTETARMSVYSYDKLNRLKLATSEGVAMREELTYDDMGNIRTLKRDGAAITTYRYVNSNRSNRLDSLEGALNGRYTYDGNGNAKSDRMKVNFTYNHLNLPQTAFRAASGNVTALAVNYLYDALGSKLSKTATVSGLTTVRDYIGGIEYHKTGTAASVIERIATEEGYLQNNSGTFVPHYYLTDHLGNVRSVIRAEGTAVAVIQKQDYYPFGKTKSILTGGINRYLYNGKEVQSELGDQLDYGARFYDAEIGRWNAVDPMADSYHSYSPYNYALNDPIGKLDPNGMWVTSADGWFTEDKDDIAAFMQQMQQDPPNKNRRKASSRPEGMSESEALSHVVTIGGKKYHQYTGNVFAQAANKINSALGGADDYFVEHKPYDPVGDKALKEGLMTAGTGIGVNYLFRGVGLLWSGAAKGGNIVQIGTIESDVMIFSSKVGKETVEGIANFVVNDGKLYLNQLHLQGSTAGNVGREALWNMAKDLGKQFNVKEVIIQGGKRTTGKYIGQVPSPIIIKID